MSTLNGWPNSWGQIRFFSGPSLLTLRDEDWIRLPSEAEIQQLESSFWVSLSAQQFAYLKLHGSYGWRSMDGSNAMVIGGEKADRISREPLLKWFLSIFETVLKGPNCKLLVVGYGFRDAHINNLIAKAIEKHNLKLYVISPAKPEEFRRNLFEHPGLALFRSEPRRIIWEGLYGYWQGTVSDLYDGGKIILTPKGESLFRSLEML